MSQENASDLASPTLKPGVENTSIMSAGSSALPSIGGEEVRAVDSITEPAVEQVVTSGSVASMSQDTPRVVASQTKALEGPCVPDPFQPDIPDDISSADLAALFSANYELMLQPLYSFLSDTAQHQHRVAHLLDTLRPAGENGKPTDLASCLNTEEVKTMQKTLSRMPQYSNKLQELAKNMKQSREKVASLRAQSQKAAQQRKWELQEKRQKQQPENESTNAFGLVGD